MSELIGKLIVKNDTKTYGEKGFRKREYVIKTESQYPQEIIIELIQDKCELIDPFKIGDTIKSSLNINGRSWVNPQGETKYFNSLSAWRIEAVEQAPVNNTPPPNKYVGEPDDNLPF